VVGSCATGKQQPLRQIGTRHLSKLLAGDADCAQHDLRSQTVLEELDLRPKRLVIASQ
jgi:hypothetical protein